MVPEFGDGGDADIGDRHKFFFEIGERTITAMDSVGEQALGEIGEFTVFEPLEKSIVVAVDAKISVVKKIAFRQKAAADHTRRVDDRIDKSKSAGDCFVADRAVFEAGNPAAAVDNFGIAPDKNYVGVRFEKGNLAGKPVPAGYVVSVHRRDIFAFGELVDIVGRGVGGAVFRQPEKPDFFRCQLFISFEDLPCIIS